MKKKKVLVGMSGGVDSSMTAYMLQKQGYEVSGVYLKLHNLREGYHEKNIAAGNSVADFLGIEYHILDLSDEFKDEVYDYFVEEYKKGNTPNPCAKCNKTIKFGAMYQFAKRLKIDYLATGHYAKTDGEFIYEAEDKTKDQSYFLAQVDKEVLSSLLFPMSEYKKEDIISSAKELPVLKNIAKAKESQEICFVDTVYTDVLKKHHNIDQEGKVLDTDGNEIGHHKGYMHYTVGKRRGFYVHGAHEAHYVKDLDPKNNTITVSTKEQLAVRSVLLDSLNMFIDKTDFTCAIKLRYRTIKIECDVKINNNQAEVLLKDEAYGIATGQVAVFYDGDKVLGSGLIYKTSTIYKD
jgi:tRNA-specific 2-thiouridylase